MNTTVAPKQRQTPVQKPNAGKGSFWQNQQLAKQRAYEKRSRTAGVKLAQLTVFTQQLASMLEAGLPLVMALEALQDQTENPVVPHHHPRRAQRRGQRHLVHRRRWRNTRARFPNLFVSMVEAGEASGGLAPILAKVAVYFEDSVKLAKKVKSAMTYPIGVMTVAVGVVALMLTAVIPKFKEMYEGFGKELPGPTQFVIDLSDFLVGTPLFLPNILYIIMGMVLFLITLRKLSRTPKGRIVKDRMLFRLPVIGTLIQRISLSRFCRTYAILLRSGVPILRTLEIVSKASGNTYIEDACRDISRNISQGGQLSETVAILPYFPATVKHMARAGEQTGNVEGMMNKIADYYDNEIDNTVEALTSLMEPALIVFLGVVIGGLVMAMFMPIFKMAEAVGG
jgi:type IV pilus assembly protein PilC